MNQNISEDMDTLNYTTISSNYDEGVVLASKIIGLVCCPFLILTLVVEIFYICQYKTTFLTRLFFYMTIPALLGAGMATVYVWTFFDVDTAFNNTSVRAYFIMIGTNYTSIVTELVLIACINFTLLSKMSKYRASSKRQTRHTTTEYMLCCCSHTKHKETIFLIIIVVVFLVLEVAIIADVQLTENLIISLSVVVGLLCILTAADLVLSLMSIVVLIVWFCRLRKNEVLKNKTKLACKKTMLIIGSLIIFLFICLLYPVIYYFIYTYSAPPLILVQAIIPGIFFAYICASMYKRQKKKSRIIAKTAHPTAPPSTRVSLPSDTAAHAPNFLSPSTAGPTETV